MRGASSGPLDDFRALARQLGSSVQNVLKTTYLILWMNGWARVMAFLLFFVGCGVILLNIWLAKYINSSVLPNVTQNLTQITERDVSDHCSSVRIGAV